VLSSRTEGPSDSLSFAGDRTCDQGRLISAIPPCERVRHRAHMHEDSQESIKKIAEFLLQLDGHSYNHPEDGCCWLGPIDRSPRQGDAPEVVKPKDLAWPNCRWGWRGIRISQSHEIGPTRGEGRGWLLLPRFGAFSPLLVTLARPLAGFLGYWRGVTPVQP
jgi:hypothetical protein